MISSLENIIKKELLKEGLVDVDDQLLWEKAQFVVYGFKYDSFTTWEIAYYSKNQAVGFMTFKLRCSINNTYIDNIDLTADIEIILN